MFEGGNFEASEILEDLIRLTLSTSAKKIPVIHA